MRERQGERWGGRFDRRPAQAEHHRPGGEERQRQCWPAHAELAGERQLLLDREHAFLSDASHELITPLTIAVVPSRRGSGLGGELLTALLDRARQEGNHAISLSAEVGMTKLYERYGFRAVEEKDGTVTMKADLD